MTDDSSSTAGTVKRGVTAVVVAYALLSLAVMLYTNCAGFPELSSWEEAAPAAPAAPASPAPSAPAESAEAVPPAEGAVEPAPATTEEGRRVGVAFADALLYVYEESMAAPLVGWLPNDRVFPTIFLDNVPSFQRGVLEAFRAALLVLRNNLTRLRTTDAIDPDVDRAWDHFNIGAEEWFFPRAEARYAEGAEALRSYRARLVTGQARFYPRADNLIQLIDQLNSVLGGTNNQLLNCMRDMRLRFSEETAGDQALSGESRVDTHVPWTEVDDAFYRARGEAFVYREVLKSVLVDFESVLGRYNADEMAASIVHDFFDLAQFEPLYVANGSFGTMWPSHPFQLLAVLSQARERLRSLRSAVGPGASGG